MNVLRCAVALVLTLTVAGAMPVRAADPFEIHAMLEMTGTAGFTGKNQSVALQAFENRLNQSGGILGRPVKFVIHDSASNPPLAVQLTNDLIAKKVPYFLGASLSATCSAQAPLLKTGPLAFCLSNAVYPPPGSFMFAASVTTANHVAAGMRYARNKGMRRVAMIVTTDTSGQTGEHDITATLAADENKVMTLVDSEHFNPTDLTVAAQLSRIKAAKPDLIIIWTTGFAAGTALRGLNEAGMEQIPVLISPGNATFAQMEQYASFLPKDLYFTLPAAMLPDQVTDPATRGMIKDLRDSMAPLNGKIDISVTAAWDSALIMVAALKKLGLAATSEQMRDYVATLKGFNGSAGRYDFVRLPQRGIGEESEYVGRWDASKNNWVSVSKTGGAST